MIRVDRLQVSITIGLLPTAPPVYVRVDTSKCCLVLNGNLSSVTHVALGSGIIFGKFELGQPICLLYSFCDSP